MKESLALVLANDLTVVLAVGAGLPSDLPAGRSPAVVRVGHFPNLRHSQALIGRENGWLDKALGSDPRVDWKAFNASPSAIEALSAAAPS